MIKCWYNIRSGYLIKYVYDIDNDDLKIYKVKYHGLKNIPHYY